MRKGVDMLTAPELLKLEMPLVRQINRELESNGYIKGTKEYYSVFNSTHTFYRKFGFINREGQNV